MSGSGSSVVGYSVVGTLVVFFSVGSSSLLASIVLSGCGVVLFRLRPRFSFFLRLVVASVGVPVVASVVASVGSSVFFLK